MCFHLGLAEKIYELVNKIYLNLMRPILASQNTFLCTTDRIDRYRGRQVGPPRRQRHQYT